MFAFCKDRVPRWNTISISGYHIREAGCTAAQEVASPRQRHRLRHRRADGGARGGRIRAAAVLLLQRPQPPPRGGGEVPRGPASLARIMTERFGARDQRSCMLRFHAQTAAACSRPSSREQHRAVAVQALAAFSEAASRCTPTRWTRLSPAHRGLRAARLRTSRCSPTSPARRHADPLGGSYAVEAMTRRIEEEPRPTSPNRRPRRLRQPSASCSAKSRSRRTATSRTSSRRRAS